MEDTYKSYKLKKKINPYLVLVCAVISIFYTVMLTSAGWYPENDGGYQETRIFETLENETLQRTLTLIRWEYSEKQKEMQVQFRIENNAFDGKDTYDFAAVDRNRGTLDAVSTYQDSEILVVTIKDVPEKWSTISLRVALNHDDPNTDYIFKLYGNDKNIKNVSRIEHLSKNGYYILDAQAGIEELEKEIKLEKKEIEKNQNSIKELSEAITAKTDAMRYMTKQEKEETQITIESLKGSSEAHQTDITEHEGNIEEYEKRIKKLNEKIQSLKIEDDE